MIYDFLFVYEVKARELENICLLKSELERRGYTVALCETWYYEHHRHEPIEAKVVFASALYKNATVDFMCSFAKNPKKVINMFWEQIYRVSDRLAEDSLYVLKENAIHATHIAWGPNTVEWLIKRCGFPEKNVLPAGHITMDFLKPRFDSYYMTKDEIQRKYNLTEYKRIVLFISSFAYVGLPDAIRDSAKRNETSSSQTEYQEFSVRSQKAVLQWFESVFENNEDTVFVYRPHPSENNNKELLKLQEKYKNFRVIQGESVKQWIKISDKIYSWVSTSIGEVYFSGNQCGILRPYPVNPVDEMEIYVGAKTITSIEEFQQDLEQYTTEFPIAEEMINKYYRNDDTYTYEIICDFCEKLLHDDSYVYDFPSGQELSVFRKIKSEIKYLLLRVSAWLLDLPFMELLINKLPHEKKQKVDNLLYARHLIMRNYSTSQEIEEVQKKIRKCIEK